MDIFKLFFPVDVDKLLVGAGYAGPADLHAAVSDVLHMEVEVEGKYVREGKRSELQFLSCNKKIKGIYQYRDKKRGMIEKKTFTLPSLTFSYTYTDRKRDRNRCKREREIAFPLKSWSKGTN